MFKLYITGDLGFEFWKDIPGYEGLYQASTYGKIRNNRRRILKPINHNKGYHKIGLHNDTIMQNYFVHRLVALTFIPNPCNYPCVNHKDENRQNNRVENLEWCTWLYNNRYSHLNERNTKKLLQLKNGIVIAEYNSALEAAKAFNISRGSLYNSARGYRKAAGFEWKYKDSSK